MKMLDRSRPFATVAGQADHKYEQDNMRFDGDGLCMDEKGYKKAHDVATRDVRTTQQADPNIQTQIDRQSGRGSVSMDTLEHPQGQVDTARPDKPPAGTAGELAALKLPKKIEHALIAGQIDSVEALTRTSEEDLGKVPGIGPSGVKSIKKALKTQKKTLA